jgi:hypothetical protein
MGERSAIGLVGFETDLPAGLHFAGTIACSIRCQISSTGMEISDGDG